MYLMSPRNAIVVATVNQDAKKLVKQARNRILQQESLPETRYEETRRTIYQFHINLQPKYRQMEQIDLVVKDYTGAIWLELENAGTVTDKIQDFLEEALLKDLVGWLILLPGWKRPYDDFYHRVVAILIQLIDDGDRLKDLRLAIAMSKCERGEIWPCRIDPEIDLFKKRLKRTHSILRRKINPNNLSFYALSTFGVLGRYDPRPNRIIEPGNKEMAVLRDRCKWQPYNMIAPLYWLNTGKKFWDNV